MITLETAVLAMVVLSGGERETVLLDFYADWCVPCRQMDPAVQGLAARGYPVRKVNIDRNRALAAKYGVDLVPCFVMLVDGQVVDRVVGGTTQSRLERMCKMAQASRPGPEPPSQWALPSVGHNNAPPNGQAASDSASVSIPAIPSHPALSGATGQSIVRPPAPESPHHASPPVRRLANPGWSPTAASPGPAPGPSVDDLIAATVWLRIKDPDGHSCGSGTIIDARGGEALILTCAHIFRDSRGTGRIEVDLFGPTPASGIPGELLRDDQGRLSYDLDRDVALVFIRTPGPVTVVRAAPPGYRVVKGDRVINVGCNNGEPPTARYSRVTSLDKYLGPPNLQVAGVPLQGRSGGGLFSQEGLLIGVCNAADPPENEGLYTALAAVHAQLDQVDLLYVCRSGGESSAAEAPLVALNPPAMPKRMPPPSDLAQATKAPYTPTDVPSDRQPMDRSQRISGQEQATLEEIRRRKSEGAEVVCVIRSRSNPQAPSEIIVLDNVSPAFLEQLAARARAPGRDLRHFTSLEISDGVRPTGGQAAQCENRPSSSRTLLEYHGGRAGRKESSHGTGWQPHWGKLGR